MTFLTDMTESFLKKIVRNAGIIFFGGATASVFNFISFTIMANQLGPKRLAILVLAQTYTLVVSDIFNIQTWESVVKFGPERTAAGGLADVIKLNLGLDVASAATAGIVAFVAAGATIQLFGWDPSAAVYLAAYSLTLAFNMTTLNIGVPRLFDRFLSVAKIGIAVAVLRLLAVVAALTYSDSLLSFTVILIACEIANNIAIGLFSLRLLRAELGPGWWKGPLVFDRSQLGFIWWTNLRTILRIPVRHFDILVIGSVMSIEKIGIYKVYKELAGVTNRLGEPINQAVFPEFTKLLGAGRGKVAADVMKRTLVLLTGGGAALTVVMLLGARLALRHFFGEGYLGDINALYCLIVLYGINFCITPINSLFIAAGFARASFFIVLLTNTIYLGSAYGFGILFGMYGIIMAYAVQMVLNQGLKGYMLHKYAGEWGASSR